MEMGGLQRTKKCKVEYILTNVIIYDSGHKTEEPKLTNDNTRGLLLSTYIVETSILPLLHH